MKLEDITPESLGEIESRWQEDRISNLVRSSMIELGADLREARQIAADFEIRAKMRAIKLHHQYGFTKKEIAELLGLQVKEINKWLR